MFISHRTTNEDTSSEAQYAASVSTLLAPGGASTVTDDAVYASLRRERDSALRELETTLWDLQRTRLEVLRSEEAHREELARHKEEASRARARAKKAEAELSKADKVRDRLEKAKEGRRRAHVELGELRGRLAEQLLASSEQSEETQRATRKAENLQSQLDTARSELQIQRSRMSSITEERTMYRDALAEAREQLETMNQWAHTTINELDVRSQLLEADVARYRGQRGILYRMVSRYRWETGGKKAVAAIEATSRESLAIASTDTSSNAPL